MPSGTEARPMAFRCCLATFSSNTFDSSGGAAVVSILESANGARRSLGFKNCNVVESGGAARPAPFARKKLAF